MRNILVAIAALALAMTGAQGASLTRLLVGFPPGQATDLARLLAERLGPALGETVIVENQPGQDGSIVLASHAQSPSDGQTSVLAPLASLVISPYMYKTVGYDALKDFAPVAQVADLPLLLVATPSLPVTTLPELIAYAKANPDKLAHPSSGNGTLSHLGMEVFKQSAGISILHIPYRGSMQAMADLMSGTISIAMDTAAATTPFIRGDKIRLIATAYSKRIDAFSDVPTVAERGFPEVDLSAWLGIVVPTATSRERIDRLGAEIKKITRSPDIVANFTSIVVIPRALGPKEFGTFLAAEDTRWRAAVKSSGVRVG